MKEFHSDEVGVKEPRHFRKSMLAKKGCITSIVGRVRSEGVLAPLHGFPRHLVRSHPFVSLVAIHGSQTGRERRSSRMQAAHMETFGWTDLPES